MPGHYPFTTVSFQQPVYNDSQQIAGYRTMHIVITRHQKEVENQIEIIAVPFAIVLFIAVCILFIFSKIKANSKIDEILSGMERFSGRTGSES